MKNLLLLLMVVGLSFSSIAQITVNKSDMASPDDTFRISNVSNVSSFDFTTTGANHTWDFSGLAAQGQALEHYVAISATPPIYNLVFMYPYIASFAQERPDAQIATISITEGYNFFKNTNTEFKEVGFGAKIQGAPIPVQYQSADVIYRFPLTYGNLDSSDAAWALSIPSLGYISEKKHRVNEVDGWGNITTPFGTFNCLRIKSTVYQVDSFHYDSIPFPFPAIPQNYTEYIWLAKNIGFPIMKATVRGLVTTASFMDSIKSFVGINQITIGNDDRISVFPNPAKTEITISSNNNDFEHIQIYSVIGEMVLEKSFHASKSQSFDVSYLKKGVYFVRVKLGDKNIDRRLIIN